MLLRAPIVALLLLALVPAPGVLAAADGPDHVLAIEKGQAPRWVGPPGPFAPNESVPGERFTWSFDLTASYTVLEVRIATDAFDVARPKQVVPRLDVSPTHYPLFVRFPTPDVWNVDGPAQVYNLTSVGNTNILRLGFAGPLSGTFILEKDTTGPVFTLGPIERVDHNSFYQETTTDEPALGDLQVRPSGGTDPAVRNPTADFAYKQRFPIQGLDPDTAYDVQAVFTDWADNVATSGVYDIRTAPRPAAAAALIEPLVPAPDATYVSPLTPIEARVTAADAESLAEVRLFLDLQERTDGLAFADGLLRYTPPAPLDVGLHRVAVETRDAYGNSQHEQWRFWVASAPDEEKEGPLPVLVPLLALVLAALVVARRR